MPHDSSRSSAKKPHWSNDSNQAWVHWEYTPEEWALFDRVDWRSAQLRYWLPNVIVPVALFLLSALLFQAGVFQVGVLGAVSFILIVVMGVLFMVRVYDYGEARKRHKARRHQTQLRVTLARKGVWEAGTFFELSGLRTVRLTSQPTVLCFRCRHKTYDRTNNTTYNYSTVNVPVPHGRENEAAQLVERFNEVIREIKQYKGYNPPEPE